jgi:hypothetical protein
VLTPRERGQQEPERGGHDRRGSDGLHRTARDEDAERRGERAHDRRERERHDAPEEEQPSPVVVGEPPGRHEEGREDDRVRVEHPGERGQLGSGERPSHRGERDVHDEQIQLRHERDGREDRQDAPAVRMPIGVHAGAPWFDH